MADAADRPFFDPWHGRNPVLRYELVSVRRAIRAGRRGCVRTAARVIGVLIVAAIVLGGAGALVRAILLAPDRLQMLRQVLTLGYGVLLLLQVVHWFLFAALTPMAHAAQSVSRERERGSWDLLRATPLEMRHIMLGKWLAVIESHPMMCAALLGSGVLLCALYITVLALQAGTLPAGSWIALALGTVLAAIVPFIGLGAGAAIGLAVSTTARSSAINTGIAQAVASVICFLGLAAVWGAASIAWFSVIARMPAGQSPGAAPVWEIVALIPFGVLLQIGTYSALALAAIAFSTWRGERLEN